jgi:hypothetical protein
MFKFITLLYYLFLASCGYSQSIDFCNALQITRNASDFQYIDSLMQSEYLSDKDVANLYTIRAIVTKERRHDFNSVKTDIDKAVELMGESSRFAYFRYQILGEEEYNNKERDLEIAKQLGFKEDKIGMGLAPTIQSGDGLLIGLEVLLPGLFQGAYKIQDEEKIIDRKWLSYGMAALVIGYATSFEEDRVSEWRGSLLKLYAPIYIDVTQFGVRWNSAGSRWFYRPELGIGYKGLSLSAGINLWLNKKPELEFNRFVTSIRYSFVF